MSIKNILISEPASPVLRQLAMQLLRKPDLRLFCFAGGERGGGEGLLQMLATERQELRFRDCKDPFLDEVWHTVNSADSIAECVKKTEKALLLAHRQKVPVFHYVSVSTVVARRTEPYSDAALSWSDEEQKHLSNETAIEQSDCRFRIYRVPWNPEEFFQSTSVWTQFGQHLSSFKNEIEDRIPGYFAAQPLRLCLREGGTIDIARIDDVVPRMEQSFRNGMGRSYVHIRTEPPLLLNECLRVLAQAVGMHLQIVPTREGHNYVDRLFGVRIEKVLRYIERSSRVPTTAVPERSSAAQVSIGVPSISLQEFVAASDLKLQSATRERADWRSRFEQKQVSLPDGNFLNYYVGGEGQKTLVLLNAYGQSFGYWDRLIQAFSPQLRMILWIPRGNDGETIGLKVASPQAVHVDDLEKVLRQEKIESCTLLAWCSGPKLALEYCQRYEGRVSSMVFVAGSFKGLQQYKALETEYEKNLEPLLGAIAKYPETADVVLEYLKGVLLTQGTQARSINELAAMSDRELQQALSTVNVSLRELVLHPFHTASIVAYANQMRDFWSHDFVTALEEIKVPVLFVGGDSDRIASQAIAKVVAERMPEAKYLEIKGGTHYLHYDRWDLLAEIIGQIVNSGGRLEFSGPRADLLDVNQDPMTMRQG